MNELFDFSHVAEHSLLWIVLLPLLGALVNGCWGGRASKGIVTGVSVGSVFMSFLLALYAFGTLLRASWGESETGAAVTQQVMGWYIESFPRSPFGYPPAAYHGAFLFPITGLALALVLFLFMREPRLHK